MKKYLFLAVLLVCSVCCSPSSIYTKLVYVGQATYYLPNGDTETYDAQFTELYFNGIKNGENLSVDYGSGNVYLFQGVPYTFKGHIVKADSNSSSFNAATSKDNEELVLLNPKEQDGFFECTYKGENYRIPAKVYYELRYRSNGNADKLNKSLIEYILKH